MSRHLHLKKRTAKQQVVTKPPAPIKKTPAPTKAPAKAKAPAKPRAKPARKKVAKSE